MLQDDAAILGCLLDRLRRPPAPHSVAGSLPVLFFGDFFTARVATIALNPSDQEYLDSHGHELEGDARRFETLGSLGAPDRASLTDEQCDRAIGRMRDYFRRAGTVYRWFRPLDRLTRAMGASFAAGEVASLNLVQEATSPVWSELFRTMPDEGQALRDGGLAFLRWQLETVPLEIALCDGRTAWDEVARLLHAEVLASGKLARTSWYAGLGSASGRPIGVAGWTIPLTKPTGLGMPGEEALGQLLGIQLRWWLRAEGGRGVSAGTLTAS